MDNDSIFIVMGVSGSGKSTVASYLALQHGGLFLEADDFHTPENKAKMSSGHPLSDEDRMPWLDRLNAEMRRVSHHGQAVFLACSALKDSYRQRLTAGLSGVRIVYLSAPVAVLRERLQQRKHHFMPASLLDSQLAVLEPPSDAIKLDVSGGLPEIAAQFQAATQV